MFYKKYLPLTVLAFGRTGTRLSVKKQQIQYFFSVLTCAIPLLTFFCLQINPGFQKTVFIFVKIIL
jgi:hypothetical protein